MAVRGAQPDSRQLSRQADWHAGLRSSRRSAVDAGWRPDGADWANGGWEERLRNLKNRRWRDFSWLTTRTLLDSANDQIAKLIHDVVNDRRQQWVAWQRAAGVEIRCPEFTIKQERARKVLIIGDPGEADASQYAVIDPLLFVDREFDSDFMVILSDVVYPAGDVNDYVNALYDAYGEYGKPILALPGNHDWYDGLDGFMFHFCGVEALPSTSFRSSSYGTPERVARMLWRSSAQPQRARLLGRRYKPDGWRPPQPGPYWALDMDGVRLVAIDTGIKGTLDHEQGEWFLRVSKGKTPKVLLTGKPLWVDGEPHETPIEWGDPDAPIDGMGDVDAVVRDPGYGYVACIGGDVHNYQRMTVRLEDDRSIEYVVAGGSGAYMSATHKIGRVGQREPKQGLPPGVSPPRDEDFRCYPTRGDSLAYYAHWFGTRTVRAVTIAFLVLGFAVLAALGWDAMGDEPAHGLFEVMGAAFLGIFAIGVLIVVPGVLAHIAMPRGYRTVGVLLVVPAVLALVAAWLASDPGDPWDWVWKAALIGLGVLLVPVALVMISYYAYSPGGERRMRLDLTICALAVAAVALYVGDFTSLRDAAFTAGLGVLAVALLLRLLTLARTILRGKAEEPDSWIGLIGRSGWFYVPAAVVLWAALPAAVAVRFWEADAIRVAVAALLMLVIVGSAAMVLVVAVGGRRALWDIAFGRGLDADKALSYLHSRGIKETLPVDGDPDRRERVGDYDERSERICELLLPGSGFPRSLLTKFVTEVGNADEPPMFKSFVTLAVDGDELVIEARGVTGWDEHEHDVPYEDCVRIPIPRE